VYRQVNESYQTHFDHLMESGLYRRLVEEGLLIPHEEVRLEAAAADQAYKTLKPEQLEFVSYPYEWCFSQLKDAALTTLRIQKLALQHEMILKDASAFNIQFHRGRPILIDTLSFESYCEGEPWVAYRQFCQHFLAPLALMSYVDLRLNALSGIHLDGLPLDLTSRLLPLASYLRPSLLFHIHMHAKTQKAMGGRASGKTAARVSRRGLLALIDSLESAVTRRSLAEKRSEWADYYSAHRYSDQAFACKEEWVDRFIERIGPRTVWDLGANTGRFSRICSRREIPTVSFDHDHLAVETNYRDARRLGDRFLLPLVIDLTNPSPAVGWAHRERDALVERGPAKAVLALALVHHLAISNNVPLDDIAELFRRVGDWLVVEFVPKEDEQAHRLLESRKDIFANYHQEGFEKAFGAHFHLEARAPITGTLRTLYLMRGLNR
jgi:ribosomal protein L11 methylase PrmA